MLWFFLLLLFLYLAIAGGHVYSGDGVVMLRVTEAMVERGEVAVRPIAGFEDYGVLEGEGGKLYGKYGLGMSLLSVPFYVVGKGLARLASAADLVAFDYPPLLYYDRSDAAEVLTAFTCSMTNALVVAGIGALVLALLLQFGFGLWPSFLLALFFALGSPTPFFAKTFFSEPLAALGLLGSFYSLVRFRKGGETSALAWSGAAFGIAVLARVASLFCLPVMLAAVVVLSGKKPRKIAAWLGPVAAFCLIVAWYNFARFGSPLETGYGAEAGAFSEPFFEGFFGLLVGPGRGALWYFPTIVFAFAGLRAWLKEDRLLPLVPFGVFVSLLLGYSSWHMWEGGWCYSPRFLYPAFPLLMVAAAYGLRSAAGCRWCRWGVGLVVVWSLAISIQSIIVDYLGFHFGIYKSIENLTETMRWSWEWSPMVAYWGLSQKHFLILPRLMVGWGGLILQVWSWLVVAAAAGAAFKWFRWLRATS